MARTLIDASLIAPFANTFIGLGRNRIINGGMMIDQRNEGALGSTIAASAVFGPDRFTGYGTALSGLFRQQRLTTTPPTGFTHYNHITVSTADSSITAADLYVFYQSIEGTNIRDFNLGTASALTVTLSFWVRSNLTGNFGGSFGNSASNRTYVFTYAISAANTWEKKTVTLTLDTSGTWVNDTGNGLVIYWDLGSGSTYQTAAGAWQGVLGTTTAGNQQIISSTSNTWDITGVQLEVGRQATAFEHQPMAHLLLQCQRYFYKMGGNLSFECIPGMSQCISSTAAYSHFLLPTIMRAAPAVTINNPTSFILWNNTATQVAVTGMSASTISKQSFEVALTVASGLAAGNATNLFAGSAAATIFCNAEF